MEKGCGSKSKATKKPTRTSPRLSGSLGPSSEAGTKRKRANSGEDTGRKKSSKMSNADSGVPTPRGTDVATFTFDQFTQFMSKELEENRKTEK